MGKYDFMIPVYVKLIKLRLRTIDQVPAVIRDKVAEELKK